MATGRPSPFNGASLRLSPAGRMFYVLSWVFFCAGLLYLVLLLSDLFFASADHSIALSPALAVSLGGPAMALAAGGYVLYLAHKDDASLRWPKEIPSQVRMYAAIGAALVGSQAPRITRPVTALEIGLAIVGLLISTAAIGMTAKVRI